MTCKYCGAPLGKAEHLPTDEGGVYTFACGTALDTTDGAAVGGEWEQSEKCRKTSA